MLKVFLNKKKRVKERCKMYIGCSLNILLNAPFQAIQWFLLPFTKIRCQIQVESLTMFLQNEKRKESKNDQM